MNQTDTPQIKAQFQIIWSIFFEIPLSTTKKFQMISLVNLLQTNKVFSNCDGEIAKKLVDGVDQVNSTYLYPQVCSISGSAVSEMRSYAQKQRKQNQYQKDFQDLINLNNQTINPKYTFEVLCFEPNIVAIEVRSLPFNASLFVEDLKVLAYLPVSDPKSNLHLYVKRLCRFILDWENKKPFEQREKLEKDIKLIVKPTFVLGFKNERQSNYFKNKHRHEAAGILTRDAKWKTWDSTLVERILDKNHSMVEHELLLIDKQGVLMSGVFPKDIKSSPSSFSIIRLLELAIVQGIILDIAQTENKQTFALAISNSCEYIKYPIKITRSNRLRGIWTERLIPEFSLKEKSLYAEKLLMEDHLKKNTADKETSPNKDQIWKIIASVLLLGFALAGFIWLPWQSAVLWLIFLIASYPVALAFTTAKQSMNNTGLREMYKLGLEQIPIIGELFKTKNPP